MKRKIAYIFTTAVISLTAFSVGKFTADATNIHKIKDLSATEYGMSMTFDNNKKIFVDTESLEKAGLININEIKGWEHWDDGKIAGIELQADNWTYEITKVPYTVDTTVTKTE